MDKKINVDLYGGKPLFGGREKPLEAHIISCDRAEQCGFYKQGRCLRVPAFLGSNCKYGKTNTVVGYTSRSKKCYGFRQKHEQDSDYHKLKYPCGDALCEVVGDEVCIRLLHCKITKSEDGTYRMEVPYGVDRAVFIPLQEVTVDFLKRIFEFVPRTLFGNDVIRAYAEKVLPDFCISLRRALPDIYAEFVKQYPDFDSVPNYIGKKALLRTLNVCDVEYKFVSSTGNRSYEKWHWDGEYLTFIDGKLSIFATNICDKYEVETFKIKPSPNTFVKVSDNAQVNENTVFE